MTPHELSEEVETEIERNREALKDTDDLLRVSRERREQAQRRVEESDETTAKAVRVLRKVGYLTDTPSNCL